MYTEKESVNLIRRAFESLSFAQFVFRQMCHDYFLMKLAGTSEDKPLVCNIILEPEESFGLSSLQLPNITRMWREDGAIWFEEEGNETQPNHFDYYRNEELLQIVEQLNQ